MVETREHFLPNFAFIGGERVTMTASGSLEHRNPSTGEAQQSTPVGGMSEVDQAVSSARAAFQLWRNWDPNQRRRTLLKFAEVIQDHRDELGRIITLEIGYPLSQSPTRADTGVKWIEANAGWADKLYGDVLPTPGYSNVSECEPLGVVGIIPTWNNSIGSFGMTAGPALAAGCTVVLKPSEYAPFGPIRMAELALEAGIPPGVINVITGDQHTAAALISHPLVEKIVFTGSPTIARRIAAACAETLKPAVFELGGKSASIVCADAPIDVAVAAASLVTLGAGQQCTLGSRLLVHRKVYDEYATKLDAALRSVLVGDPFDAAVQMGPVVSQDSLDRTLALLERARSYGSVRVGGTRPLGANSDGYFLSPTVVEGITNSSELAQSELFAPVLAMMAYEDDDEAIMIANDSEFALAGYVFTSDVDRAYRVSRALDTENVGINGAAIPLGPGLPFGGRKASGYGKQGGLAGVMEFVRVRSFSTRLH